MITSTLEANYDSKKKLALHILKNKETDLCEYFINEGINPEFTSTIIQLIENDEIDEKDLNNYCFSKKHNYEIDKRISEICKNIRLTYFIIYNNKKDDLHIFSSDGNLYMNFESNYLKPHECTGLFSKYADLEIINLHKFYKEINHLIPEYGEYDIIIKTLNI